MAIDRAMLLEWCRIPVEVLEHHPNRRMEVRIVADSHEMDGAMAAELFDLVSAHIRSGLPTRAIVPCGPVGWYRPFADRVNDAGLSLATLETFQMDECLDWQGQLLPAGHPYNFQSILARNFYEPVDEPLRVPSSHRHWLTPETMKTVAAAIDSSPIDLALGGWGQDGHVAYNQARRDPYHPLGLEEVAQSTVRIQENNVDTMMSIAHRTFGGAYQFAPPMSVTLGMRECLGARRVRLFSDTGAWKQTALRIALFSKPDPEYPITLFQNHPDSLLTATVDTADHPISRHPEWQLS